MQNLGQVGVNVDLSILEQTCDIVMGGDGTNPNFDQANKSLMEFQNRDDAWIYAPKLIDNTTSIAAKFFGLQILHNLVKIKWAIMDQEQKESIKNFVCQHVFNWSQQEGVVNYVLNQIDAVLVELILKEWPQEWPSIVNDLISSATTEPRTCQNNLKVIAMLSHQVVDFGSQEMTSTRILQVSAALNGIAPDVFQLVEQVLSGTNDSQVIISSLEAFRYIVKWLDSHFIFETELLGALCNSFLINPQYQSYVLSIIGEIASKPNIPDRYTQIFPGIFDLIVTALRQTISDSNIVDLAFESPETIKSLTFTLSSILSAYGSVIEQSKQFESLGTALNWIIEIMNITDFDNFKTCCELWKTLIRRYYLEKNVVAFDFYNPFFPVIRRIMIKRMERPVEILIVEQDDGTIEKEVTKNSSQVDHYNTMRECLVFLSNIDGKDMVAAISERIEQLHQQYSIATLNSICWSAGAISGTLSYPDEKKFVIMVIKELLQLNSNENATKEDKATIASGIMFVCSSYPRFLTDNWSFLKEIEKKLFDFMQNDFPGVKEMAVDSFTRIAEKCRSKFLLPESNGDPAFIEILIRDFDGITSHLSNELRAEMIKATAIIIAGCRDDGQKGKLTHDLMVEMNNKWLFQINQFVANDPNCLINILFILRCNMFVASNVGLAYQGQLQTIIDQMITMYGSCCGTCTNMIAQGGDAMSQAEVFRICLQIKSTIIQILIKFTSTTNNIPVIKNTILPPITMKILEEYANSNPYCRIPELLTLMEIIISKVGDQTVSGFMNQIMMQLFKPSVDLICSEFDSFMQFRIPLTDFMSSVVKYAFNSYASLPADAITMMEKTIEWGCQHPNFDICKKNIQLLLDLFTATEKSTEQSFKNQFYASFYMSAVDTIFVVMTDTIHKFAFAEQAKLLRKLFSMQVEQRNPEMITELLYNKFQNRQPQFFSLVIQYLFSHVNSQTEFNDHLRDFLVEVKQVSSEDPDFFVEERNKEKLKNQKINEEIPGMTGPAEINDDLAFLE
ncbi:hypothetical protein M9Y10_009791 [Tritrichomonas musculus]|uniref:Importin N-terminal domain-containing protein n=1 Tax=Tritrichomonas musculus TaxID=1915356 RepID=A0ABR2IQA0_9EUKA